MRKIELFISGICFVIKSAVFKNIASQISEIFLHFQNTRMFSPRRLARKTPHETPQTQRTDNSFERGSITDFVDT